jgi:outer membrane protein OmpA-like peptidoglycan-associated protein
LGNKVNSFANEMFPSITNSTLYFSSDLFTGKGGLDIYSSQVNRDEFSAPTHLEGAINSSSDDFAYQEIETNKGYFSSNRPGGKGSDAIYSFKKETNLKITGFTKQKGSDNLILPQAKITVYTLDNKMVKSFLTDQAGNYKTVLPMDQNYVFKASKKGFASVSDSLLISKSPRFGTVSKNFYLTKELKIQKEQVVINIAPIFFDFDESTITEIAISQLKFALNFLEKYPTVKFKLKAHTDSRGDRDYNLKLSKRRASSVHTYLIISGINADRIVSVKGYGEALLVNECDNKTKCSEQRHEENRRMDFVIDPETM